MNITKFTSCFIFLSIILLSDYERVKGSISPFNEEEELQEVGLFGFKPKTLFVFGDSYADTGNTPLIISPSWKYPYGISFPGKPTGRFTDGRVSTDFLANYLGLKTPIAYRRRRRYARSQEIVKNGMNFAFGGSGVFDTIFRTPIANSQIGYFEQLLKNQVYSSADLNSSVAFFSIVGNDYLTYNKLNGTKESRPAFIRNVVNQILSEVKRIKELGVRKVLVALSPPQLCVPFIITHNGCDTNDPSTLLHNNLLKEGLMKLNDETNEDSFLILDLYKAFVTIFKNKGVPGVSTFPEPLKTCCVGKSKSNTCGDVGKRGEKLFNLCEDPKSFFFWDDVHITEQGWRSVFSILLPHSRF